MARHSGMCLDVAYALTTAGAQVVQGTCWHGPNQQWRVVS
ncbi:RICIN domain-containing protein [Cellulomonas chitinilytica]|nr:RICIN domain-containing protein [Cellulomonas chitinilytica]